MTPTASLPAGRSPAAKYSPDTIRGHIRAVQHSAEDLGRSSKDLGAEELGAISSIPLHQRQLALGTVENRQLGLY